MTSKSLTVHAYRIVQFFGPLTYLEGLAVTAKAKRPPKNYQLANMHGYTARQIETKPPTGAIQIIHSPHHDLLNAFVHLIKILLTSQDESNQEKLIHQVD